MGALATSAPNMLWEASSITGIVSGNNMNIWPDTSGNSIEAQRNAVSGNVLWNSTGTPAGGPVVSFGGGYLDMFDTFVNASSLPQSLLAVIRLDELTHYHTIFGSEVDGGLAFIIETGTGKPQLWRQNVANLGTSTTSLAAATWYVVIATIASGGAWSFHVNGAAAGSGTSTPSLSGSPHMKLGTYGAGGPLRMHGQAAVLGRWNRVLTGTEITDISTEMQTVHLSSAVNKLRVGTSTPSALKVGTSTVTKAYVGTNLVYG